MRIFTKYTDDEVDYQIAKFRTSPKFLWPLWYLHTLWVIHHSEKGVDACYREWQERAERDVRRLEGWLKRAEKMLETRINWQTYIAQRDGVVNSCLDEEMRMLEEIKKTLAKSKSNIENEGREKSCCSKG
ncbi:MAG: hypothetical protein ACE5GF_10015 [Thermodesulfobacteriota bacterium]